MTFRTQLRATFERRQAVNPSYSLRAFARTLAIDHSTLAQILRQRRRLTARTMHKLGARLGLPNADIDEYCVLENEAAILDALSHRGFRTDSRWLAVTLGIPLDQVNIALQRLLRKGLLIMQSRKVWQSLREVSNG